VCGPGHDQYWTRSRPPERPRERVPGGPAPRPVLTRDDDQPRMLAPGVGGDGSLRPPALGRDKEADVPTPTEYVIQPGLDEVVHHRMDIFFSRRVGPPCVELAWNVEQVQLRVVGPRQSDGLRKDTVPTSRQRGRAHDDRTGHAVSLASATRRRPRWATEPTCVSVRIRSRPGGGMDGSAPRVDDTTGC
jgi:hypothetical protein